ncbi:MAG: hypothetical protein ABI884_05230 [Gemmatimonadota bacterium]
MPNSASAASAQYLERVAVETHGQVKPIPVSQIDCIAAAGPYAELYGGDRRYVIQEAIQSWRIASTRTALCACTDR